jgi:asparagine synthase (glutamine-hydrolysing)
MCGIAGIYNKDTSLLNHSVKHVDNMLNKMEKRGPDNRGKFLSKSNKVVLGHNRLSIQDLDKRSNQPFVSKDGRYTLVFNGEIYNFKELRHQYLQGVDFRTESDTEVLLEMFQLMGIKALDYFKGMFSFAIWDEYEENLILVRDPYGIKPLYYAHGEFGFCFSSQVQPISDCLPGMNTMEPAGLVGFYMWGNVPEPWTLYKDVLQVPKGSYIVVKEGEIVEEKNWYSFSQHWENQNRSEIDLRLIVKNSVSESVKRHLVSDVPVCIFLSGGIDSCAVASLASQYNNRIEGITLSFDEFQKSKDDELPLARLAADKFNIKSSNRVVTKDEFLKDIPVILEDMDQPSIDGINTWYVSKAAKELNYKVALSGVGGDELFCGYPSFNQIPKLYNLLNSVSSIPFSNKIITTSFKLLSDITKKQKLDYLATYSSSLKDLFYFKRALFMPEEIGEFVDRDLLSEGLEKLLLRENKLHIDSFFEEPLSQLGYLESNYYLCNQLLRDSDWASMSHSIELRTPLVDAELLKSIGPHVNQMKGMKGKKMLADSPEIKLPDVIINKKKTGFSLPINNWLHEAVNSMGQQKNYSNEDSWARNWSKALIGQKFDL